MLSELIKTKVFEHLKVRTKTDNWNIIFPEIDSIEAIVYRLSSPDYHKDLALKVYHDRRVLSSSKGQSQYSAIERFYSANNDKNCRYRTPEPYGLFTEDGFYILEWVTGKNLRDILWRNCLHKKNLQKYIKEASAWVSSYHSQANLNIAEVDVSRYLQRINSSILSLEAQHFCSNNQIFQAGFETLKTYAEYFVGYETRHADIHGDLNLGNIIIDHNYITGIDIGSNVHAPIQNDLTQMLHYICINYFNMLTRSDMRKEMREWEIFNVTLNAYKYGNEPKEREFFLFVFLYQSLIGWVSVHHTHQNYKEHTQLFIILGKWRFYNSSMIVKSLTKVINDVYLK